MRVGVVPAAMLTSLAAKPNTPGVVAVAAVHGQSMALKSDGTVVGFMVQVAEVVGVHETTVGRAAANKWMLTPHGLREFRWFFTSGVSTSDGGTVAQEGVQEMIADILARENPAEPLADEAITAELRKRGVQIARRTVAKYREALNILPSHLRKSFS